MNAVEYLEQRKKELKCKPHTVVKNIKEAIELAKQYEKFYIIADYDCDGICAGTSAYYLLKEFGKDVTLRFPKRFSEGYGLSLKIVDEIIDTVDKDTLICTVDNGIAAYDAIKKLKDNGYKILLTDHHLVPVTNGETLYPPADVIINESDGFSKGNTPWCGAGLVYTLMEQLDVSHQCKNTVTFLAGLATVGDMVPLVNGNRKLVKEALQIANEMEYLYEPVLALIKFLNSEIITEDTFGFQLAPMINAAGRLYDNGAEGVFKTLTGDNRDNIKVLGDINKKRKDLSFYYTNMAKNIVNKKDTVLIPEIDVPLGICGLVAGQLTEDFNVPSFVFHQTDENTLKGSVRSVDSINIYQRVKNVATRHPELILGYGGHAQAMGIAIKKENFVDFKKAITEEIQEKEETKEFTGDAIITPFDDFKKIERLMNFLAPFGVGNPAPVFQMYGYTVNNTNILGEHKEHIKFYGDMTALGFSLAQKYEEYNSPLKLDLLVTPSVNVFMCKSEMQLLINDLRPAI